MTAELRVDAFLLAGQFPGTSHAEALGNALSYAEAAEADGFDGVWVAEHHFISYGTCPSALAFAAYLFGRTSRVRVGTAACVLSDRHPVALAEEAALLAELSGGRLDLGVAWGGPWIDLHVFGTGLPRYAEGFAESLDLLLAWLSGAETVAGRGDFFRFPPVTVVPRPTRPVPVFVAATGAQTSKLTSERGLPMLLGMHATPGEKRQLLDGYRHAEHGSAHVAYVADTLEEARATLRRSMPGWLATTAQYRRIDGSTGPARDPGAYVEHLLDIHPVGPPDLCVQRLVEAVTVTGVRRLLLMVEGAGDRDLTCANIARLGAQVIPELMARTAFDNGHRFQ